MKNRSDIQLKKEGLIRRIKMISISCMLFLPFALSAQTDSTAAAPAADAAELIAPSLQFTAVQKSDNTIDLKAALKAKVKGLSYPLYKLKVTFYRTVNEEDNELGFIITDGSGKAMLNIKADTLKTDAEGRLSFKAVFSGNRAMEPAEEIVSFKRARLEIIPAKEDSLLSAGIKLVDIGSGKEIPVKDATVGIYVKRLFLPQKAGEGTTDENGEATVEFPNGLPGDAKGNLTLLAKVDENETYGYLEASSVQNWGKPVSDKMEDQPRALWSSHPPLWMLITFALLMLVVWGHYAVIVLQLFRLRKEEPHTPSATN